MGHTSTSRRGAPQTVRRRGSASGSGSWTTFLIVVLSLVTLVNVCRYIQLKETGAGEGSIGGDQEIGSQGLHPDQDRVETVKEVLISADGPALHPRLLPLGRDLPLTVIRADAPHGDHAVYDGDTALIDFPCSLSEPPEESRGGTGPHQRFSGSRRQGKPLSSWGPCVISCSNEPNGDFLGAAAMAAAEGRLVTPSYRAGVGSVEMAGNYTVGDLNQCERAFRACVLYQECTHLILPSQEAGSEQGGHGEVDSCGDSEASRRYATLMHFPRGDNSLSAVEAAAGANGAWGGAAKGFTLDVRPRTYYVVSFGGSGSKMLGGWLSERGQDYVKQVFHLHDPNPSGKLFAKQVGRGVRPGKGKGKDFRGYDFPEGAFPTSGPEVKDVDSYRVILIFKDPVEALISRYFYAHCKNLRGADCGASPDAFPSIERYAEEEGEDRLKMALFYDNYCSPQNMDRPVRNYPVVCINYHKMWDNPLALVRALGLPAQEASKLPVRTETVRNDETSAARGEPFTLALREKLRKKQYSLSEKIFEAPAVAIV